MVSRIQNAILIISIIQTIALNSCGIQTSEVSILIGKSTQSMDILGSVDLPYLSEHSGFDLTAVDTYQIRIDGCSSGFTGVFSQDNLTNRLYKNDTLCKGKLLQFFYRGILYLPDASQGFINYLPGETALFNSQDLSRSFYVKVESQLSSPLLSGDSINYSFWKVQDSGQNPTILGIQTGIVNQVIVSGSAAPNFAIRSKEIIFTETSTQSLRIKIKLECNTLLTSTQSTSNVACSTIKLRTIKYVLIKDIYNDAPCTSATSKVCKGLIPKNAPSVATNTTEYIPPGTNGLVNGGFITKLTTTTALMTPTNTATNPNMILLLSTGTSYQYFNLDLQVSRSY